MSKFYSLNKLNTERHTLNKRSKIKMGVFVYLIIFSIIFSSLAYVIQINSIVTKGFKIEELEKKANQLRNENKKLEITITQLQSIARAEEVVGRLGLVKSFGIEYLKVGGGTVVVR